MPASLKIPKKQNSNKYTVKGKNGSDDVKYDK